MNIIIEDFALSGLSLKLISIDYDLSSIAFIIDCISSSCVAIKLSDLST